MFSLSHMFAPGVIQQLRVGVYVDFSLDEVAHPSQSIFPGQPLSFRWGVYDYRVRTPQTEDPAYATATATLLFNGNVIFGPSAERTARIPILDRGMELAREFYQIGQTIPLQLEVTGVGLPPLTASLSLDVVGEDVNADWWEWDVGGNSFRWKQDTFTPSGQMHNRSLWTRMTVVPVLHHDNISPLDNLLPPQQLVPQGAATFDLAPSSSVPITFPGIQSIWEWFNRIVLLPDGPFDRSFSDQVAFTVTDPFGNSYPETLSSVKTNWFDVSNEKRQELGAAAYSQGVAVFFTAAAAFAWVAAPVLLGIAATAEAVAQVAAVAALDPPQPNPNFMEPVQFVAPPLSVALSQSQQFANLASFLDFSGRILAARDALSETQSRLLGAQVAMSPAGMKLQTTTYQNLLNQMINDTVKLLEQVPNVVQSLQGTKMFDLQMLQQALTTWQKEGLPQNISHSLSEAGLSREGLANLDAAMRDPSTGKQITTIEESLQQLAWALAGVTHEIRKGVLESLNVTMAGITLPDVIAPQIKDLKAPTVKQAEAGVLSSPQQVVAPADQASKLARPPSAPAQLSLQGKEELEATLIMRSQRMGLKAQVQLPSGRTIPITTEQVMVGRGISDTSEAAALDLSSEPEKATVSRIHAQITRVDDHFEIEDRNSSNQTRLNQEILVPRRRYRLSNGDIIEFGKVRCIFGLE